MGYLHIYLHSDQYVIDKISEKEMQVVETGMEYKETFFLDVDDHILYADGYSEGLIKIAANVKRVLSDSEHVYESLDGNYYSLRKNGMIMIIHFILLKKLIVQMKNSQELHKMGQHM